MTGADDWRGRVLSASQTVLGAGIVLDSRHVLTCAHVVPPEARPEPGVGPDAGSDPEPAWDLLVDTVGTLPVQRRRARVAPGGWVPRRATADHVDGGDLALLELDEPLTDVPGPALYQFAIKRGTALSTYGFPHADTSGVWARTVVRGTSGELVQVDVAQPGGAGIDRGFSGSGLVDGRGRVVGMVMSRLAGSSAGIAWMMPVEAIARYLPVLRPQVRGIPAVPPSMRQRGEAAPALHEEVRRITELLSPQRNTLLILTGEPGGRRAVIDLLAASTTPQHGAGPPRATIDLALDASGLTTDQVATRIARRLGIDVTGPTELLACLHDSGTGVTVVLDDVDGAADPAGLISDLLVPLSELGSGAGQVVAGLTDDPGVTSRNSRSLRLPVGGPTGTAGERLDRLDELISLVRAAEAEGARGRTEFAGAQRHPPKADRLRLHVTKLRRYAGPTQVNAALVAALDTAEASANRALTRARQHLDRQAERHELRGRLDAYQARSAAAGLAEDIALAGLFARASAALHGSPCDLARCREAVDEYQLAVWHRLGLTLPGTAELVLPDEPEYASRIEDHE